MPITIKNSRDVEGVVSTAGTEGRTSYVPERSATAVVVCCGTSVSGLPIDVQILAAP